MVETAIQKKLPDTIVYGKGAIAWKTDVARLKIWSSSQRYEWVQYLDAVRNCYQAEGSWKQIPYRYYLQMTSSLAGRWLRENKPDIPRQRFDWLIYGGCERATERQMMVRLTDALLQSGATVGYLVRFGTEEHQQILSLQEKYRQQLTPVDLYSGVHGQRRRLAACAAPRAWRDFQQINQLLDNRDLRIPPTTFSFFLGGMAQRLLWERVSPYLEYDNVIVRNHFGSIDSVIALRQSTSRQARGHPAAWGDFLHRVSFLFWQIRCLPSARRQRSFCEEWIPRSGNKRVLCLLLEGSYLQARCSTRSRKSAILSTTAPCW
ncbi:MAG: hypothetical protein KatS3mg022_3230 [Armatimonadota bacterium]|nr:MAG: hypothetical protein KatS3mg022_3230 [Armatimonadota bacterium]